MKYQNRFPVDSFDFAASPTKKKRDAPDKKSRYMPPQFVADGFKKLPSNDNVYLVIKQPIQESTPTPPGQTRMQAVWVGGVEEFQNRT